MDEKTITDVTNRLLDRYAEVEGIESDYAIAKHLGCSYATVHNYRNYKTKMDATTAIQIAESLRINPIEIIAQVELERSPTARKVKVWDKYRGRILLAASLALMPIWGQFAHKTAIAAEHAIHYTHILVGDRAGVSRYATMSRSGACGSDQGMLLRAPYSGSGQPIVLRHSMAQFDRFQSDLTVIREYRFPKVAAP